MAFTLTLMLQQNYLCFQLIDQNQSHDQDCTRGPGNAMIGTLNEHWTNSTSNYLTKNATIFGKEGANGSKWF